MTHALEPRRGRDARNTWGPRVFAQSPIPRRRPTRPFGDFRAFPHHTRPLGGRARAGVGRASPRDARYERGCRRRRAPRDVAFSARPPSGDSFVGPKSGCRASERPRDAQGERLSRARGFPGAQSEKQVNTVPLSICVSSHAKASFERKTEDFLLKKRHGNVAATRSFLRSFSESSGRNGNITRAIFCHDDRRSFTFSLFAHGDISTFQRVRFDAAATIRASRAYTYSNLDNTQPVQ